LIAKKTPLQSLRLWHDGARDQMALLAAKSVKLAPVLRLIALGMILGVIKRA
jgi:hypothetical protein